MPQKTYVGYNSIKNLSRILSKHKPKKIFLVSGRSSYIKSGAEMALNPILKEYKVVHFTNFTENPKLEEVEQGISLIKREKCDFVIAVGGGTAIDMAKSISILSTNLENPKKYLSKEKKIDKKGPTFVAIPTTAGTGSEATCFAVLYIDKIKFSLEHNFMLPDYAIVDAKFSISLPKKVAISTGLDAMSQAIESYWSINSTDESKKYARAALKLILKNFDEAVHTSSKKSKINMAKAAYLAGKAINISKTTACHAFSYTLTSYWGVPHGMAVAVSLPSVYLFNSMTDENSCQDARGWKYVETVFQDLNKIFKCSNSKKVATLLKNTLKQFNIVNLRQFGVKKSDLKFLTSQVNIERLSNNPKRMSQKDVWNFYEKIL